MSWTNNDGLFIRIGTEEGNPGYGGAYNTRGDLQELEVKIPMTNSTTTSDAGSTTATIIGTVQGSAGYILPAGARIEEVEIVAETAVTGGGTLDIGLVRSDRTTAYDDDGLIAALAATAIDAAGEKTVLRVGSTGAGALIGTTLANSGYLVASYNTTAFTAGKIAVRVRYYMPQTTG